MGFDISHYDGILSKKNFKDIKESGQSFVYIKLTEGSGYLDPTASYNAEMAKEAGIWHGFYHFFDTANVNSQVEHFITHLDILKYTPHVNLPPVLDYEIPANLETEDNLNTFLSKLKEKYGVLPVLYASPGNIVNMKFVDHHLWVAEYGVKEPSIKHWAFWQYTDTGKLPGLSNDFDLNKFCGSEEDLKNWLSSN